MTLSVTHTFQSAKGDPADTTLVRPSNWNAEHTFTLAADKLVGRDASGAGAAQEIACTALGRSIFGASTIAALQAYLGVFSTGDIKLTLKTTADTGWVMMDDGTIGSATSGATTRANADTADLYALLWNNVSDTYAPVTTGRGANAAADFAANKPIALTKVLGRALAAAGAGSGLTSRALGLTAGAETHTLTAAESATLTYTSAVTDPGHVHTESYPGAGGAWGGGSGYQASPQNTGSATTGVTVATTSDAGDGAHNNVQPTAFLNVMVRL